MSIYLLRHTETTWNVEKRFQGSKEGKVTEEGKKRVEVLSKSPFWDRINTIYYPNNYRTGFVAESIKREHPTITIKIDDRLMERSMGDYEGLLYSESPERNVFDLDNYEKRYVWKPPGGESHDEVSNRVLGFYNYICGKGKTENILCVTSRGVIKTMLKEIYNLSLEQMYSIKSPPLTLLHLGENNYYEINPISAE